MRQHLIIAFLSCLSFTVWGQQGQIQFGKNRVQFHRQFDEWMQYETKNFLTVWYGDGRKIAESVALLAEADLAYIHNFFDYSPQEKIRLIVYTDLTDLKQTNIGTEEAFTNTAGHTFIRDNKAFVYFNGDHQHLRKQIREGIVKVYLQNMIIGDSWQEMVQNAALMSLPEWYVEGLASYVSDEWSPEMDLWLMDQLNDKKYRNFFDLVNEHPKKAGHAMWYYLSQAYGISNTQNLIFLTRLNRSLEMAFIHVYGNSMKEVSIQWEVYFRKRFEQDAKGRNTFAESQKINIKNKKKLPTPQMKLSPNGQKSLYVQNEIGKAKVYIQSQDGKRKMIFKKGYRNPFQATDYNYPQVAWHPSGKSIAIIYKQRDQLYLSQYDIETKKTTTEEFAPGFQDILSLDYVNGRTMVISAAVRGYSDIFLYYPSKRQGKRITFDPWDDLDAVSSRIRNQSGILFISNRPDSLLQKTKQDSILPIGDFNVFYYNLDSMTNELVQLTHTPHANEKSPISIDSTWFGYLSDQSGIFNREVGFLKDEIVLYQTVYKMKDGLEIVVPKDSILADLDSTFVDTTWTRPVWRPQAYVHPVSNYNRSIAYQSFANGRLVNQVTFNETPSFFRDSLSLTDIGSISNAQYLINREYQPAKRISERPLTDKTDTVIVDQIPEVDYYFVTPFEDIVVEPIAELEDESLSTFSPKHEGTRYLYLNPGKLAPFRSSRITPHRLRFKTDRLTTQIDNGLLFGGLDSYAGSPENFTTPPPGLLLKGNIKDLFEDYELEGGLRFDLTLSQIEYFLEYWNRKHRLDKQYGLYLKKASDSEFLALRNLPYTRRTQTVIGTNQWRYPLDLYRSFRATATLRFDRWLEASTDTVTLFAPVVREKRAGLKVEYVFDNTLDVHHNIKNGTRYKIYAEYVKKFNIDFEDGADFSFDNGYMGIVGFDGRHYQRIAKHSILALRAAGATSFGTEKLLYVMGGTENWLLPKYNELTPVPNDNFAYRTLAANMRGFRQNIRNGNSFLLVNSELRFPIFRYLSRRPFKSNFLNNIQLIGFADAGLAWTGKDPFRDDSPLNTLVIPDPTATIKIKYFKDPTIFGYGFGIRSMLFGYFIRADYAWGIETKTIQKPIFYISMGTDF